MANISIRQLQYFLALVKAGSFSGAAEQIGVTQSTLSAAIQGLEAELGAILIDRSGRRIQLLPAGEELVARACEIVALVGELPEHARLAERPLTTRLRMGVIPSIAPFMLPKILPATTQSFPDLDFSVREGLTRPLLDAVRSGALDVALIALPYPLEKLEKSDLFVDNFYMAVKRDHALSNYSYVQADDIGGLPFLLLENGHCLREHVITAIGSKPSEMATKVHATSITTLVQLVEFGMGVTLLPGLALKTIITPNSNIHIIPFEGENNSRTLSLVWREGAARRQEYQLFADHLKQNCFELS